MSTFDGLAGHNIVAVLSSQVVQVPQTLAFAGISTSSPKSKRMNSTKEGESAALRQSIPVRDIRRL